MGSYTQSYITNIKCLECGVVYERNVKDIRKRPACLDCTRSRQYNKQQISLEQFKERAFLVHQDKYDYSRVFMTIQRHGKYRYTVANDISCKCGEVFKQLTHHHLNNAKGCPHCKNKTERTVLKFLRELANNQTIIQTQPSP